MEFQLNPKRFLGAHLCLKRHVSTYKPENVYLVDEDDTSGSDISNNVNKYTQRTHTCGDLRSDNVGERVVLCGWLEFQRMNKFVVLRDSYGVTQLIISEKVINLIHTTKVIGRVAGLENAKTAAIFAP